MNKHVQADMNLFTKHTIKEIKKARNKSYFLKSFSLLKYREKLLTKCVKYFKKKKSFEY